jgi:hypothetical protein
LEAVPTLSIFRCVLMNEDVASGEARRRVGCSRREALARLGAGTLAALGLWPGSLDLKAGTGEAGTFRFVVVNDTHYVSPDCGPWLERAVRQMKGEGPEFCLLCGDLTEKGKPEHLGTVREIFRSLDAPTYAVPGNHDYVAPTDRRPYERTYPRRLNYWFEHRGWQFVGLDTTDGQRWEKTLVPPATFQWLDENLGRLAPWKPTVLFTHFPLGAGVKMRPGKADDLLERFRFFNLRGIYCGHWHGSTLRWERNIFAVTSPCCALKRGNHDGSAGKGYLVCEARDGVLTRRFVECHLTAGEKALLAAEKK